MKKATVLLFVLLAGVYAYGFAEGGHWEIGGHYSYWSIDVISSWAEDNLVSEFDDFDPKKGKLDFDSHGNNYGIELRYFPKGKNGSFSIGFSYERNNFLSDVTGTYTESDGNGNQAKVEADGTINLYPHSFNVNLRWEIAPRARIHPYIGLGFGFGVQDGKYVLHTKTTTYYQGNTQISESIEEKTLKQVLDELKEEGNEFPVGFFPIIQVQVGLRLELMENIYILAEGAVYDGIAFRGGLAFRF